jgi:hypothetical protein
MIGSVSKTARKVIGWFSSILRSVTRGLARGLRPRPSSSCGTTLFTTASTTSSRTWARNRFLMTSGGVLPGRKPGSLTVRAYSRARVSISLSTTSGSISKLRAFRTDVSSMYSTFKRVTSSEKWRKRAAGRTGGATSE